MHILPRSAPALFHASATRDPGAIALRAPCGTLSYGELDARAARLAARLIALGAGPERLIGICLERSFDQIVSILATWKAGAAFLPLDPAWPDARLRMIANDAACTLVIGRDDTAARLGPDAPTVIAPDQDGDKTAPAFDPAPDSLAYVIYTSGSTGTPKGVEITHANLAALIAWHNDAFAVTAQDRGSHLAGLGFDASLWEVWPYLAAGASVSLIDEPARTSGAKLRDWLLAERVTVAFAPTALADELIAADWPANAALRTLLTGADRLLVHPRAGLPFALVNNYGPTESTVVATSATVPAGVGVDTLPPIGHPIAGTIIHILDQTGAPVAPGIVGEIVIGGAQVARGYRGRPDLTAERFLMHEGQRVYRTGDKGAWLPDGQIAYHGRIDDQAKIRGHRIEPEEVAAALRLHPAITAATVAARAGDDGEAHLVGYVVFGAGEVPSAEKLGGWLADRLPDYMVPGAFAKLDALPLTANGKVDRAALPPPCAANALVSAGFAAPETPAQQRLAEILSEVLARGPVGIDDNFFLLGGHSLLGTQVVLRAGDAFGVELTLRHLFLAPTIRQLAALIEDIVLSMIEAMSDDEAQQRAAG
ncbi:MAG: amino acid adenylation protein [Sphingomonas bacterium]|nr:amino acid adenylation protein [Sphingomonas bacterium]